MRYYGEMGVEVGVNDARKYESAVEKFCFAIKTKIETHAYTQILNILFICVGNGAAERNEVLQTV